MQAQRRFEGNTLAAVLAEVQKEFGVDVKIASAQKVRSGGIGGFFQRERFEVIVDLAPSEEKTEPRAEEQKPASLLDLAEAFNEVESVIEKPPVSEPAAEKPVVVERSEPEPEASRSAGSPPAKQISTETDSFAEVLSRVAFQADMKSTPADIVEAEEAKPIIPDRPAILDVPPPAPAVERMREIHDAPSPIRTRITDSPLAKLGLPPDYIPVGVEGKKLHSALVNMLGELPVAPEVRPSKGAIIAVVGERTEAVAFAEQLCERWGQPSETIVLATQTFRGKGPSTVVRTVRAAEDSKRSWSRRPHATIVAVDAHPSAGDATWAQHVLSAFEPIATYGVADATRKAEDISAWAKALGGIDALVVNDMDDTVSPASIIATDIPVDRIDGRKASPAYWAMLLVDRLNQQ